MELEHQTLKDLLSIGCQYAKTGSREICNPSPKDADKDYVVCTFDLICFGKVHEYMRGCGFEIDGEDEEFQEYDEMIEQFVSYRKENLNMIVTNSSPYFRKFKAATKIAKMLNLRDKRQRIALFQSILYGRNENLYMINNEEDLF